MTYDDWSRQALLEELNRRDLEQAAAQQTFKSLNLLEMLHQAQVDFISVDSETNIFHQMLDNFLRVTGCDYGFIDELFLKDDGTMYLEARSITNIAWDDESRAIYQKLVSGEIRFDNLKSLYGEVMKSGKPVIANDAPADPRRCGIPKGHPPLRAFLGLPLYAGSDFVGVLGLANAPDGFSEALIRHLEPLTTICAIIMNSFKIDRKRREHLEEVRQIADELRASEARYRTLYEEVEHRVRERTAELTATNSELESFAYAVSHDLRRPLRALDGFSQALLEDCADKLDGESLQDLRMVREAAQEMGQLIEDLLKLSTVTRAELNKTTLDLTSMARKIVERLESECVDSPTRVDVADGLEARGDPALVSIVLENLLENAFKFSSKASEPRIQFKVEQQDRAGVFLVKDNGVGFNMDYAEKLFAPFQRLHRRHEYPGTGIGLATVRRILLRHGGRVWADSEPGKGATFYFQLPDSPPGHAP